MSKLYSRKLIVSVLVMATGLTVALIKGDIPPNILQLLEVMAGTYVAGNVISGIGKRGKEDQEEGEELTPASPPGPIETIPSQPLPASRQDLVEVYGAIKVLEQKTDSLIEMNNTIARVLNAMMEGKK